ncbi:MAG: Trm112 family protein [Terriglobales bacterium]
MPLSPELLKILVCPDDHAPVRLVQGETGLQCERCRRVYPIRDGIPVMLIEEATDASGAPHG